MSLNIESLEYILNNNNHTILNKTYHKINTEKNDSLQQIIKDKNKLKDINKKLKEYRYIDEISDIVIGNYCRWINLNNINLNLEKGGYISSVNISENGPYITVKIFNKCINIKANEILLYQKLNSQEILLLKVMKYIEK